MAEATEVKQPGAQGLSEKGTEGREDPEKTKKKQEDPEGARTQELLATVKQFVQGKGPLDPSSFWPRLGKVMISYEGKDKSTRAIQYGGRWIQYYLLLQPENTPMRIMGERITKTTSALSLHRKLFRIGRYVDDFVAAFRVLPTLAVAPRLGLLRFLRHVGVAFFAIFDHGVWFCRAVKPTPSPRLESNLAFWSVFARVVGDTANVLLAFGDLRNKNKEPKEAWLALVRFLCDVGTYLPLALARVGSASDPIWTARQRVFHAGWIGLAGCISSLISFRAAFQGTKAVASSTKKPKEPLPAAGSSGGAASGEKDPGQGRAGQGETGNEQQVAVIGGQSLNKRRLDSLMGA